MWPWGHLAVGYLLYSLGLRRTNRLPDSPEVFLLALGTQLPDLVDKPLSWELGLLVSGRSLGHSLLVAAVILAVLYVGLAPRIGRSRVTAFAVGYLSHPFADLPYVDLLAGEYATSAYLVWPLRSMPPDDLERSIIEYLLSFQPGPFDYVQFALVLLALGLWYLDGRPGWRELQGLLARTSESSSQR
jgi:membrane-bound metal-dependent hydrolase YbcI (DUF457 family)